RRVHVDDTRGTRARIGERVNDIRRSSDEQSGLPVHGGIADQELRLALDDVERGDVELVDVWRRPPEPPLELELPERDLVASDLGRGDARPSLEPVAFAGRSDRGAGRRIRWWIERVVAGRVVRRRVAACAQRFDESAARCVEVEEPGFGV